jgi:hypothetical protein
LKANQIGLGFKIEVNRIPALCKHPGKGCFPALARPKQGCDRRALQRLGQLFEIGWSVDHGSHYTLKIRIVNPDFQ